MIDPTDEMTDAAYAACEESLTEIEAADMRRIVRAVLAIVERDQAAESEAVAAVLAAFRASRAKGFSWTRGAVAEALRALDRATP